MPFTLLQTCRCLPTRQAGHGGERSGSTVHVRQTSDVLDVVNAFWFSNVRFGRAFALFTTCAATVSVKDNMENWDGRRLKRMGKRQTRSSLGTKASRKSPRNAGGGAALQWLPGFCAVTEFSSRMAVCSTDKSGAWHMLPTDDEAAGQRGCAKRCTRCRNCRFVSYSMMDNDCSWYADCNLRALGDSPSGHHSAQVKSGAGSELTRPPRSRVAANRPTHHPRP